MLGVGIVLACEFRRPGNRAHERPERLGVTSAPVFYDQLADVVAAVFSADPLRGGSRGSARAARSRGPLRLCHAPRARVRRREPGLASQAALPVDADGSIAGHARRQSRRQPGSRARRRRHADAAPEPHLRRRPGARRDHVCDDRGRRRARPSRPRPRTCVPAVRSSSCRISRRRRSRRARITAARTAPTDAGCATSSGTGIRTRPTPRIWWTTRFCCVRRTATCARFTIGTWRDSSPARSGCRGSTAAGIPATSDLDPWCRDVFLAHPAVR